MTDYEKGQMAIIYDLLHLIRLPVRKKATELCVFLDEYLVSRRSSISDTQQPTGERSYYR